MAPIAVTTNSKNFAPVSEGVHNLVLTAVIDLGIVMDKMYGPKDKLAFIYLTDESDEEGQAKLITKSFNKTLGEKSGLRKEIKGLTRKDPPRDIPDVTALIGTQGVVVIEHNEAKDGSGKVYGNIAAFMPPNGKTVSIPDGWTAPKELVTALRNKGMASASRPVDDNYIPF